MTDRVYEAGAISDSAARLAGRLERRAYAFRLVGNTIIADQLADMAEQADEISEAITRLIHDIVVTDSGHEFSTTGGITKVKADEE